MVHCVFWLFSGGAPASQPASQPARKGGGKSVGFPKTPNHPAAARRSSLGLKIHYSPTGVTATNFKMQCPTRPF